LKEVNVYFPIVTTLGKIWPAPFAFALANTIQDSRSSKQQSRLGRISSELLFAWPVFAVLQSSQIMASRCQLLEGATDLMLPQVKVIHINKGDSIPVLIVIESNSDLVKYQLSIKAWSVFVQLMVHDDLGENRQ
jgi:hypothetical protein